MDETKKLTNKILLLSVFLSFTLLSDSAVGLAQSATIKPSKELTNAIIELYKTEDPQLDQEKWDSRRPPFSFVEIDLNQDGIKETIVLYRLRKCYNRGCYIDIFKKNESAKKYKIVGESQSISTSRGNLEVGLLPTRTNGWQDLAVEMFSYETRTVDWYPAKFNGKSYQQSKQKLKQRPRRIILSQKSREFKLPNLSN
jgi:hypothetical protein